MIAQNQQRSLAAQQGQQAVQYGNQQQQQSQPQQQQQQQQQPHQQMQQQQSQQGGSLTPADLRQLANHSMATITRGQQQGGSTPQQAQQSQSNMAAKLNLSSSQLTPSQMQQLSKYMAATQAHAQQALQIQQQQQQQQQQSQMSGSIQLQTPQMGGQHLLKTPQTGNALPQSSPALGSETQTPGMWMQGNGQRQNSAGPVGPNGQDVQGTLGWAANMNEQHMNQVRSPIGGCRTEDAAILTSFPLEKLRSIYASHQGRLGLPNGPNLPRQMSSGTAGSVASPQNMQMNQNQAAMVNQQQRAQMLQQTQSQSQQQNLNEQATMANGQMPNTPNIQAVIDGQGLYRQVSDDDLINTVKTMIPKLNAQLRTTEAVSRLVMNRKFKPI
jgi:hypothetical protein